MVLWLNIRRESEGRGGGGVSALSDFECGLVILEAGDLLGFLHPASLEFTQHSVKKQKHPVRDSCASG